jgi:hypothetical protein
VTGNILRGAMLLSSSRATRRFIAKDFPVPGPATTRIRRLVDAAMVYAGDPGARLSDQGKLLPQTESDLEGWNTSPLACLPLEIAFCFLNLPARGVRVLARRTAHRLGPAPVRSPTYRDRPQETHMDRLKSCSCI